MTKAVTELWGSGEWEDVTGEEGETFCEDSVPALFFYNSSDQCTDPP